MPINYKYTAFTSLPIHWALCTLIPYEDSKGIYLSTINMNNHYPSSFYSGVGQEDPYVNKYVL